MPTFNADQLYEIAFRVLRGAGVSENEAEIVATELKDANLVGGAEAVFHGAQKPVRAEPLTFQIQNDIDDVLEHAGPGDIAVFRHVSDEHDRNAARLCPTHQRSGTLAQLGDTAR